MMIEKNQDYLAMQGASANPAQGTRQQKRSARYFFVVMAILFIMIALFGFIPSYRDMYAGQFTIHWLAHIHGALMTSWLLVFLAQAIFAANGQLNMHRRLGQFSVVLGVLIWISMVMVTVRSVIGNHPAADSFLFDVLLPECYEIILFGLFFSWGMLFRKNGAAHKRFLFLATLLLLQAGIDRITWLRIGIPPFLYTDLLLILLFVYDRVTLKRIHKITWIGTVLYIAGQIVVIIMWGSPAWHQYWFKVLEKFYH